MMRFNQTVKTSDSGSQDTQFMDHVSSSSILCYFWDLVPILFQAFSSFSSCTQPTSSCSLSNHNSEIFTSYMDSLATRLDLHSYGWLWFSVPFQCSSQNWYLNTSRLGRIAPKIETTANIWKNVRLIPAAIVPFKDKDLAPILESRASSTFLTLVVHLMISNFDPDQKFQTLNEIKSFLNQMKNN